MARRWLLQVLVVGFSLLATTSAENGGGFELNGTIAFATVGRVNYAFDIFSVPVPKDVLSSTSLGLTQLKETRLTDGKSVNYNGHLINLAKRSRLAEDLNLGQNGGDLLAYVSERDGSAQIYFNFFFDENAEDLEGSIFSKNPISGARRRAREEQPVAGPFCLLKDSGPALYDRPSFAGDRIVYVSTKDPISRPRESSSAVFSIHSKTGIINRLTPQGVTDYSPAVSPSGEWVMLASSQGRGWNGDHVLHTDLYVSNVVDGSNRRLVVENGGWPTWADDRRVYFHRQAEDGWWSIYQLTFSHNVITQGPMKVERVTPPGVHAMTPAASRTGNWIAVATRRPGSIIRHIEIFNLNTKKFVKLTEPINPTMDHYNPFVASDSGSVGYHRCRGNKVNAQSFPSLKPHVEHIKSTASKELSVIRIDGSFPSFSPDGSMIVYIPGINGLEADETGVHVMNLDGSGSRRIYVGRVFGTVWDKKKKGTVYGSIGPSFASEDSTVHILTIYNADGADTEADSSWKILTKIGSGNNAFPSPSPDGKYLVFRSGRSGAKNLYIMDAVLGEEKYLRRLTEGDWDDTMASWSPDNEWIAFSSDRDNPGSGSFALYMIHPNGTGLHTVLNSGLGGRINHPNFSPDSKSIVFTSDLAGQSADPISVPDQFQPSGEIFIAQIDGTGVQRLTHNGYEDGTPSWGCAFIARSDLSNAGSEVDCNFSDDRWLATPDNLADSRICGIR